MPEQIDNPGKDKGKIIKDALKREAMGKGPIKDALDKIKDRIDKKGDK